MALLFGTWFRIVNHSEYNTMSSEAVAKSVAGSLFHTCADNPHMIEKAVEVLQILIDDFGVANMFGRENIQYFADMTRTGIRVQERFEYRYPMEGSVPCELLYRARLRFYPLLCLCCTSLVKNGEADPVMSMCTSTVTWQRQLYHVLWILSPAWVKRAFSLVIFCP